MSVKILFSILSFLVICSFILKPERVLAQEGSACRSFFNNDGYFFDNYEKVNYSEQGFLQIHLKLKQPYNDGRGFGSNIFLHQPDCVTELLPVRGVTPPPGLQYYSLRFSSPLHYDIWDDEQDKKIICSGCSVDLPATTQNGATYTTVSFKGAIDVIASVFHSGSFPISKEAAPSRTPIILLPGLLGTELNDDLGKIWLNLPKMVLSQDDAFLDALKMDESGIAINSKVRPNGVLNKVDYTFGTFHYMDNLVQDLETAGYKQGTDLFLFPYDWRLNVSDLASLLKVKINEVLGISQQSKVILFGHSLGGLVIKEALADEDLDTKVHSVIFVGVPHLGSADAARTLIFGNSLGMPLLNADRIRILAQNMPSIYDLLPSYKYFDRIPGYFDDFSDSNVKRILTYEQSNSFLAGLGKNASLMNQSSQREHLELSVKDKPYKVHNIVSCGKPTMQTINKMYSGEPSFLKKVLNQSKYRVMTSSGDGTVLQQSSEGVDGSHYYLSKVTHNQMLVDELGRKLILSLLNEEPSLPAGVSQDPSPCPMRGALINLPSNLELAIKKNSKILTPEQDYQEEVIGDDKFVVLPEEDGYDLEARGGVPAEVNFTVTKYGEQSTKTIYFDNVQNNTTNILNLKLANGEEELVIRDSEGLPVETLEPIAVSEGTDQEPPMTTVSNYTTGEGIKDGVLTFSPSEKKAKLNVVDTGSGIYQLLYSYDQGETWERFDRRRSFLELPLNLRTLTYFSEDKAGNLENKKTVLIEWVEDQKELEEPKNDDKEKEDKEEKIEKDKVEEIDELEEEVENNDSNTEVSEPDDEEILQSWSSVPDINIEINNNQPPESKNTETFVQTPTSELRVEQHFEFPSVLSLVGKGIKYILSKL